MDSAACLAIALAAKAQPDSPLQRVVAIAQPIHSTPCIQERAFELCKALNAEIITVDQSSLHDQLYQACESAIGIEGSKYSRGMLICNQ